MKAEGATPPNEAGSKTLINTPLQRGVLALWSTWEACAFEGRRVVPSP